MGSPSSLPGRYRDAITACIFEAGAERAALLAESAFEISRECIVAYDLDCTPLVTEEASSWL